mmetsp:Transcript_24824/g.54622  ORF Transcript_24824/g.54622 Transcript_24824/m.54622 type:complete len:501 (+) Transcript_24824:1-1503(+)
MAGGTEVNLSFSPQKSTASKLDLKLIDETYGRNADLYEDVLRVPTSATQDEIQLAYFDRRSELFTMLAKLDAASRSPRSEPSMLTNVDQRRYLAERKMDSVVFAVRILADPSKRKAYNEIRPERTGVLSAPHSHSSKGYTLDQSHSKTENGMSSPIRKSESAASQSSSRSSKNKATPQNSRGQRTPRVVTPTESPPLISAPPSASESKNWIQSTFSASLFSGPGKVDGVVEFEKDEERNPRKSKRRQKQQKVQSRSPRDAELVREAQSEKSLGKEKKSIWGRKKKKKRRQLKDEDSAPDVNDSMETNITDTSLTDYEDAHHRYNNRRDIDSRPANSTRGSTPNENNEMNAPGYNTNPRKAVRREVEGRRERRRETEDNDTIIDDDTTLRDDDTQTFIDDDTRTFIDDDTRTFIDDGETFATMSIFSNPEEPNGKGTCGGDGMFGCISGSKAFRKMAREVSGACEDTMVSVDQVFHAFTLTDKDIKAVTKKINKAKRQLDN